MTSIAIPSSDGTDRNAADCLAGTPCPPLKNPERLHLIHCRFEDGLP
jgi:hypothetical protein